jgi:hypothetical protein
VTYILPETGGNMTVEMRASDMVMERMVLNGEKQIDIEGPLY